MELLVFVYILIGTVVVSTLIGIAGTASNRELPIEMPILKTAVQVTVWPLLILLMMYYYIREEVSRGTG